jgi:fatty acid desaturase
MVAVAPADVGTRPGMVPPPDALPAVLPTTRLNHRAMPIGELRDELRRIPSARNAGHVVALWAQTLGVIALVTWLSVRVPPAAAVVLWAATFALNGRAFARFSILAHEAAHRLLLRRRTFNDTVGRWLLAYPAFVPFDLYRRAHLAHHRDELGPDEPDIGLYAGYPIPRASMRRKLTRDALGVSGWKNLRVLLGALRSSVGRPVALRILAAQLGVAGVLVAIGGWGRWWLYPLLWLGPWMTVWRVLNRLRAIAEHGGMTRSQDRRMTTHVIRQTWPARFWIVPYNTGWHLAHHVDMGVPFRNLPRLHDELVAAGWVTAALVHPSYRALWGDLVSIGSPPARL